MLAYHITGGLPSKLHMTVTAGAFRTALETRLQARAQEERTDLQRLRRQVAFDRFLARLFPKGPKGTYPWILKGGYAMELRIRSARTTKDIDLTLDDGTRLAKDPTSGESKCGRCYKTPPRSNSKITTRLRQGEGRVYLPIDHKFLTSHSGNRSARTDTPRKRGMGCAKRVDAGRSKKFAFQGGSSDGNYVSKV
jgi:hypothetical protein